MNLWGDGVRPVLLLRGQDGENNPVTLPVPLNAIEAGVTLSQSAKNSRPVSIHRAAQLLLSSMDLRIARCVFVAIRQQKQFVRLDFINHPRQNSIELPAEDAMSLCLYLEVPIYASLNFIHESRALLAELEGLVEGLKLNPEVLKRNHTYIQ